jgi:hypothetical protein
MQQALNLPKQPFGHVLHQLGHLGREDFPKIDKVVLFRFHNQRIRYNPQK